MSNQTENVISNTINLKQQIDMNREELAVDIRNAFFEYKSGATVLDVLSLQIPRGCYSH